TGSCTVDIPEWLYDRDCPGLYMRRIKSVSVSVPSVVGPYTSVNCTLSMQRSTVRVSALLDGGVYARDTSHQDDRFVDYFGATAGQSSQAVMFNLRYDFPTEWSAFVNGSADFGVKVEKSFLPYMVQSAKTISVDKLTLYAQSAGKVVPVTPTVDLGALSTSLS